MSTQSPTKVPLPPFFPLPFYLTVFVTLLALTGLTVTVAFFHLGRFNDIVALAIAGTKALVVILYFMHVRYSHSKLLWVVVAGGFFWLVILMVLTMSDYLTREFLAYPATGRWPL